MFDTDNWEPSGAARARNTAFLAAGMVTNGLSMSKATEIASAISGEEVPESAIMNTVVPVSHLKREAAGVAKSSHAIFSRMNAQRYISWNDTQLHQGILPENASLDWAKLTVVARYIAEANIRYDPTFRKIAREVGVPYVIVKGSWAYVGREDYDLTGGSWEDVKPPNSYLVRKGSLAQAYTEHSARLTTQIMRTYNELASDDKSANLESLLKMAENLRTRKTTKKVQISSGTDTLASATTHQQSASIAAEYTASSATSYNALLQSYGEFTLSDRNLTQKGSYIVAVNRRLEDILPQLQPFIQILASRHTWIRAFEILNHLLGNHRTSLDRMNKLHRSMTQSSQTIEVDVPLTSKAKQSLAPHALALIKKSLIKAGPKVALPRYITNIQGAVKRGEHAQLLRSIGDHLTEYKEAWAERYESWARVYALAKVTKAESIKYGAAASAFRTLKGSQLVSRSTQYCDGSNLKSSYLYKMASDYARKRNLAKPKVPIKPISGGMEYARMLDEQYNCAVTFEEVVQFVTPRLDMFADDLTIGLEPRIPMEDEPEKDLPTEDPTAQFNADLDELEALLAMDDDGDAFQITEGKVLSSYPDGVDPDKVARANGYSDFAEAYEKLGGEARWDTETSYTRRGMLSAEKSQVEADDSVMF